MLNLKEIEKTFSSSIEGCCLLTFDEIESTSSFLKEWADSHQGNALCMTNTQTAGYGQRERSWLSNADSITISYLLELPLPVSAIGGLPLLVAWSIVDVINELTGKYLFIKWPNDIYSDELKAGGILVEQVSSTESACRLVIGIGLNNRNTITVSDTYTGSESQCGHIELDERQLPVFIIELTKRLLHLSHFMRCNTLELMLPMIQKYDYFRPNQPVIVYHSDQVLSGLYKGLTPQGYVMIEVDGQLVTYHSGLTSIRALKE